MKEQEYINTIDLIENEIIRVYKDGEIKGEFVIMIPGSNGRSEGNNFISITSAMIEENPMQSSVFYKADLKSWDLYVDKDHPEMIDDDGDTYVEWKNSDFDAPVGNIKSLRNYYNE